MVYAARRGRLRRPRTLLCSYNESYILIYMSKRLQVLLDESEWLEIRRTARASRMTVAEWVRQALRAARAGRPGADTGKKLDVIRSAARHAFL